LQESGRLDEAISHLRTALKLNPAEADIHYKLGVALEQQGDLDEAILHYRKALTALPKKSEICTALGSILSRQGYWDDAVPYFQKALSLEPDNAAAHFEFGTALGRRSRFAEAIPHFQKALAIQPDYVEARINLGVALAQLGRLDEAADPLHRVPKTSAKYPQAEQILTRIQTIEDQTKRSLEKQREAIHKNPKDIALLNDVAWTLATSPLASIRNGAEATELAHRAVELSEGREPAILGTLAAAYAEAGRFTEAVATLRKASVLAEEQHKTTLGKSLRAKLPLYEAKMPYREMPAFP
jgi:Flp pilus assembly protein TadD